ncbi:MAG: hypothetical protein R2838_25600 [Caldilineaceae bacterium]
MASLRGGDIRTGDAFVVASRRAALGRGRDDRRGQRVVLAQPVGEVDAVDGALALAVAVPERGLGHAADVTAHDDFDQQRRADAGHGHVGIGRGDQMVADDVGRLCKPERGQLVEHLALVGHQAEDAIEGRQPVGGDEEEPVVAAVYVAHFAAGLGAEERQIGRPQGKGQPRGEQVRCEHGAPAFLLRRAGRRRAAARVLNITPKL